MNMRRITQLLDNYLPEGTTERLSKLVEDTSKSIAKLTDDCNKLKDTYKEYIPAGVTAENTLRAYNLMVAMLVFKDYFSNPQAELFGEYGLDIAVHLLQASISSVSLDSLKVAGISANAIRLANIVTHVLSGNSTIPTVANLIDISNHSGNMYHSFSSLTAAKSNQDNTANLVDAGVQADKSQLENSAAPEAEDAEEAQENDHVVTRRSTRKGH